MSEREAPRPYGAARRAELRGRLGTAGQSGWDYFQPARQSERNRDVDFSAADRSAGSGASDHVAIRGEWRYRFTAIIVSACGVAAAVTAIVMRHVS